MAKEYKLPKIAKYMHDKHVYSYSSACCFHVGEIFETKDEAYKAVVSRIIEYYNEVKYFDDIVDEVKKKESVEKYLNNTPYEKPEYFDEYDFCFSVFVKFQKKPFKKLLFFTYSDFDLFFEDIWKNIEDKEFYSI